MQMSLAIELQRCHYRSLQTNLSYSNHVRIPVSSRISSTVKTRTERRYLLRAGERINQVGTRDMAWMEVLYFAYLTARCFSPLINFPKILVKKQYEASLFGSVIN